MKYFLDILLLLPLLYGAWKGFKNGFVYELALLCALIAGIYIGVRFSSYASGYIAHKMNIPGSLLPFASFVFVFLLVAAGILLLGKILDVSLKITALGIPNRLAGLLFGLLKWALILSIVLYLFSPLDNKYRLISEDKKSASILYQPVNKFSVAAIPVLNSFRKKIQFRTSSPE